MNERTREKERESIREEVWLLLREGLRKEENNAKKCKSERQREWSV